MNEEQYDKSDMKITKLSKLESFVIKKHWHQQRKYTGEPYHKHLFAVAMLAQKTNANYGYEIGICHDLFEDTDCTEAELKSCLAGAGYGIVAQAWIISVVKELTDVYTAEASRELNRKARKHLECLRLHLASPDAQTVKCADIINNAESIAHHDKGFAKVCLPEFVALLNGFNKADKAILSRAWDVINFSLTQID